MGRILSGRKGLQLKNLSAAMAGNDTFQKKSIIQEKNIHNSAKTYDILTK